MANKESSRDALRSPLRFPGGKAFLCDYIERFLHLNDLQPNLFIEPFAGGASISLYLLGKGMINKIALFDRDPLIASFWLTVFNDGKWLQNKLNEAEVTLKEWIKQQNLPLNGHRKNAWKCLYLNRTSFSGIIANRAGPLGGKNQSSDYKIDCRFYRETLLKRLKTLHKHKDKVAKVGIADWKDTLDYYVNSPKSQQNGLFFYLDPPFFHKAENLYNYFFKSEDHEELICRLSEHKQPWLLSYDYCPEAVSLIRKYRMQYRLVPVRYTSSVNHKRYIKKEIVSSNLLLPKGG